MPALWPRHVVLQPVLVAKCVLDLGKELVRIQTPAVLDVANVVVVDDKERPERMERPAELRVRPHRPAGGVVLEVTAYPQIRRDVHPHACPGDRLRELTLAKITAGRLARQR